MTASGEIFAVIHARFADVQEIPKAAGQVRGDELYIAVPPASIVDVCRYLHTDPAMAFDYLSFVTAIDYKTYFEIVYYLVSHEFRRKLVIKSKIENRADAETESVTVIFPTADWQEREIFDLMGIRFKGHYNMRRILLPDDWEGYPLRKDYVPKPDRYD